jgi:hypothetical protein
MLKTTKKLKLNREQLRVLTDESLERVNGGYPNSAGSGWCSSDTLKCTHSCKTGNYSQLCVNK